MTHRDNIDVNARNTLYNIDIVLDTIHSDNAIRQYIVLMMIIYYTQYTIIMPMDANAILLDAIHCDNTASVVRSRIGL